MIKTALTAAAFSLLASAASAELLTCKTTQVSKSGFVNLAAAQSWFPEEFKIRISGEEAVSDFYGQGTAKIKSGRTYITFVLASSKNTKTKVKLTFIPKTAKFVGRLNSPGNYAQTPGASGSCTVS